MITLIYLIAAAVSPTVSVTIGGILLTIFADILIEG